MFDTLNLCSTIRKSVGQLEKLLESNEGSDITSEELKEIFEVVQIIESVGNKAASQYANSTNWAKEGYLSGKSAIVHETGLSSKTINEALARGKFLKKFPNVMDALRANSITNDHINSLLPLISEEYIEFYLDDESLLTETATKLPAKEFSQVVRHWKNIVDALIDKPTDEYEAFQNRKLYLNELLDGSWLIHGELDPITGKILKNALDSISQKLWHSADAQSRIIYSPAQQRADAIGYLAQEHKQAIADLSSPALQADVVIDVSSLNSDKSTKDYLKKHASTQSLLASAHSKKHIEQILCDSSVQIPIKRQDGSFDLGRKIRTAPWRMKKQLVLSNETCSAPGCITPATWCDAHHVKHWVHGGETKLENLVLLCRRHHTMIHNDKTFAEKMGNVKNQHAPPLVNSS